jgi:hypothetical protein
MKRSMLIVVLVATTVALAQGPLRRDLEGEHIESRIRSETRQL